jgi:hypothetical protein
LVFGVPVAEQPTIFLSHSTGKLPAGDLALQVKDALIGALEAKGWSVFLDSHTVKGGDLWRTEILHSLATSKAGIILLNEDAAKSDWVKAEALIMCFRKSINSAFPLLPIVLPGADIDATFLKTYEPFQFNEIQRSMFTLKPGESVHTFAKSVANNPNLERGKQSVPAAADWVQRVVDIIGGLKPDVLSRVVGKLKLTAVPELLEPAPAEQICLRVRWALANLLHHESPQASFDAVKLLIPALSEESAWRLRPHLESKWVENESAELLLLAARAPEQQGLLGLNTNLQLVVDRYTERLTTEIPLDGPIPRLIPVSQPNGDFDEAGLTQLVEQAITKRLFPIQRLDENGDPMPLEKAVAEVLQPDGFAVAVLWPPYCGRSFLKKLRARFPRIIFIALSVGKAQTASECVEAGGRDLIPKLTSQKLNELSDLIANWDNLLELNFAQRRSLT